jgi:hypothetical protein
MPDVPPAGKSAYAIKCGCEGRVYDELKPARDFYHAHQHRGKHPVFAIFQSLTAAVAFTRRGRG